MRQDVLILFEEDVEAESDMNRSVARSQMY